MGTALTAAQLEEVCADLEGIDAWLATLDPERRINPGSHCQCFMAEYVRYVLGYDGFIWVDTDCIEVRDVEGETRVALSAQNTHWQLHMLSDRGYALNSDMTVARARHLLHLYMAAEARC